MNLARISSIVQYVLLAVSVVVFVLFYTNGTGEDVVNSNVFVDYGLYLGYAFFVIAGAVTLVLSLVNFVKNLMANPKGAVKSLGSMVGIAAVIGIAYALADGTPLYMPTYDGPDNVEGWLKFADTIIYSIYALTALAVISLVVTSVIRIFR